MFNAETLIEGFCSGAIGIGITLLLIIPINLVVHHLTGIESLNAILPPVGGAALVVISMALTFIAGLIPPGIAARKDLSKRCAPNNTIFDLQKDVFRRKTSFFSSAIFTKATF